MKSQGPILYEVQDEVAWITINEPEKMNRLTFAAMRSMTQALRAAELDEGIKIIVITGAGDRAFCVGADLADFTTDSILEAKEKLSAYAELCLTLHALTKPSIAMINGYALAGGCGLAILPTFSIAADTAKFGVPEIKAGLWPMMVMAILFRTVGRKKGLEMICTGELIDAGEAERIGMITRTVPSSTLREEVLNLIDRLKALPYPIMRLGLECFSRCEDMPFEQAIWYLRDAVVLLSHTPESREARAAFFAKKSAS